MFWYVLLGSDYLCFLILLDLSVHKTGAGNDLVDDHNASVPPCGAELN